MSAKIFAALLAILFGVPAASGATFAYFFKSMSLRRCSVLGASVLPACVVAPGFVDGMLVGFQGWTTGIIVFLSFLGGGLTFIIGILFSTLTAEWVQLRSPETPD